jgi:hypothetical protein
VADRKSLLAVLRVKRLTRREVSPTHSVTRDKYFLFPQELKMEKSKKTRCSDEKEDQAFDKLVKKYKQQIEKTVDLKKWYE